MYSKLFSSLWKGSLYGARNEQHVFVYLLGNCDAEGIVDVVPEAIASATGIPVEEVRGALVALEGPDPRSRSTEEQGRRIKRLDPDREWGWLIVNYQKYRSITSQEHRRTYFREYQRQRRARLRSSQNHNAGKRGKRSVQQGSTNSERQAEAEAEAEEEVLLRRSSRSTTSSSIQPTVNGNDVNVDSTDPDELTPEQFFLEVFWPEYPRKTAKNAALKAWKALKLSPSDDAAAEAIMAGLKRDIASEWKDRPIDKIPHASTWINQRRWEDLGT